MSGFWGSSTVGRPDPHRQRRAQRLIERFHAGLVDAAGYLRGLQALFAEEFAEEVAGLEVAPAAPVTDLATGTAPDGTGSLDDAGDAERIRRMFPTREDAPGLWLVLADDRCHFCGRHLPVLALKRSGDDPGGWVHICLDDLELIRSQAHGALESG